MNERIRQLREQSLQAKPSISMERAWLLTEFYKSNICGQVSVPIQRALAFNHILKNKKICINHGELIVGERGPAPKATPTYPEVCLHSPEDLDTLNSREKIPYHVISNDKSFHEKEIIPFWQGKSIRQQIFKAVTDEWKAAYEAGVFTEFMEQRSPGHTVLGDKIYKKGMLEIIADIRDSITNLDFLNDPLALDKREELNAMEIAAQALIGFAHRYAEKLRSMIGETDSIKRQKELEQMVAICERVPANAPQTFWEALQYYWFVHIGVITELNPWDSFNPGRLDQHLYPFYRKERDSGELTEEKARELLQAFWIKFNNQPAPPKVGVTAKESSTYTDFALINVGGMKTDGSDATNELSYLILDIIEEMRILQPSSMVQLSKKNPDQLIKRAIKIIKTGFGQPSIFNSDAIVQELVRQGKSVEDARNGGASGCVEAGAFGTESYILTGYFNLTKILELTLNNGIDPQTGKQLGLETGNGNAIHFGTFDDLMVAFKKQLDHFINIKIEGNNIIERIYTRYLPAPFLSILIDDCIQNGKDYHAGGSRYNTSYIQGVGLGSITDSLTAIKYNVFDKKRVSMADLLNALHNNFDNSESIHRMLINDTPKYGNDDDYADDIAREVFQLFFNSVDGRPNTKGGTHRINLLPTTSHVYFGSVIGAMPDGREAYEPLSEGISPVQGGDRHGPTAVLKSASKIDHIKTGGTLLNQKFTPQLLSDETGVTKLAHLIRAYFRMDGHHIQFNVVTAETLRQAQKEPEKYRDLIVRVAGYSDYFVDLSEQLQNEIILRTEHAEV